MSETQSAIQLTYKWTSRDRLLETMLNLRCETVEEADQLAAQLLERGLIPVPQPQCEPVPAEGQPAFVSETGGSTAAAAAQPVSWEAAPAGRVEEGVDDFDEPEHLCPEHDQPMLRSTNPKITWPQWYCPARNDDGTYCHWQWTPRKQFQIWVPKARKGAA